MDVNLKCCFCDRETMVGARLCFPKAELDTLKDTPTLFCVMLVSRPFKGGSFLDASVVALSALSAQPSVDAGETGEDTFRSLVFNTVGLIKAETGRADRSVRDLQYRDLSDIFGNPTSNTGPKCDHIGSGTVDDDIPCSLILSERVFSS
ncbi:hypothetical protein KIPB_000530 [Kipferlia bialata]|uniref:Uncharacterized protein n=1 Tax=Kipferlia bialata TaxID=797122 RepID=A0A9K3GER6_9EUKA|nr:hypothetical protein KIPB_000530 [Kipferlia bialata]|eukprot:g530.t1